LAEKEDQAEKLACFNCGIHAGDLRLPSGPMENVMTCQHFVVDHTDPEKPSTTPKTEYGAVLAGIVEGSAQILCLNCNVDKTYNSSHDEGGTCRSHTARAKFLLNLAQYESQETKRKSPWEI